MKIYNSISKRFTTIPNGLINDKTVSSQARFLFIYMASKPNDWDFYNEELANGCLWSVDTLRKYMKEIIASNWVRRSKQKNSHGYFGGFDYYLASDKNEDTVYEIFRHGKVPRHTKELNIISNKKSIQNSLNKDYRLFIGNKNNELKANSRWLKKYSEALLNLSKVDLTDEIRQYKVALKRNKFLIKTTFYKFISDPEYYAQNWDRNTTYKEDLPYEISGIKTAKMKRNGN